MRRKRCYSAFQADEDDVLCHQPYIMIIFKVSELESSEGVPGLGGGDQAGFALWLTLLQVFSLFHYLCSLAGVFLIVLYPVYDDYVMLMLKLMSMLMLIMMLMLMLLLMLMLMLT